MAPPHCTAAAERLARDYTVTFLGCGNLNTAILGGILASLAEKPVPDGTPKPTKFICCVRSEKSVERLKSALGPLASKVTPAVNDNINAVESADIVVLGCKPFVFRELLAEPGLTKALKNKVLVSILAGVTTDMLVTAATTTSDTPEFVPVRVMPSVAAMVRQSMTAIEMSTPPLPAAIDDVLTWMFSQIGQIVRLPRASMDAVTSLCGSGPAFAAVAIEGLADGAVAMGVPRAEAILMAAQTVKGAAELVLKGDHPALLREKVSTPGGCTIAGTLVLEEAGVRGQIARAVREATTVASQLGSGVKNVNGTRF